METTYEKITEEQFESYFSLMYNHIDLNSSFDNKMFETFGLELLFVKEMALQNRVVTIIETDSDEVNEDGDTIPNMCYVSGMHHVNRIGYLITETPLTLDFECKID
jgi:hypothetical protein